MDQRQPGQGEGVRQRRAEGPVGQGAARRRHRPAWKSVTFLDDPLASTLGTEARHAVTAGLLEKPDLKGIYDLTLLDKVLKAEGEKEVDDAGLGAE